MRQISALFSQIASELKQQLPNDDKIDNGTECTPKLDHANCRILIHLCAHIGGPAPSPTLRHGLPEAPSWLLADEGIGTGIEGC
jgi:hypothetical protein